MRVCLDYGHGGKDSGAVGNGLKEKDIVLQVGNKITSILKQHNVDVIHTRNTDVFVELHERAQIANKANADIFVSLHCNSFTNPNAQGVEVFHHPASKQGFELSKTILDSIVADRLYTKNRGVKMDNFAVLRLTKMPSALAELGFISNTEDIEILVNRQDDLAVAVAKGILKYMGISYKSVTQKPNTLDDQYKKAVTELMNHNIIGSPATWLNLDTVNVNNVKSLVIKMCAYINQGI